LNEQGGYLLRKYFGKKNSARKEKEIADEKINTAIEQFRNTTGVFTVKSPSKFFPLVTKAKDLIKNCTPAFLVKKTLLILN